MTSARAVLMLGLACVAGGTAGCRPPRPEGDAIVVALANSPVNLDPRVGAHEASQKAHQHAAVRRAIGFAVDRDAFVKLNDLSRTAPAARAGTSAPRASDPSTELRVDLRLSRVEREWGPASAEKCRLAT
jgi:ABC-type transport system substrate-binding protein